MSNDIHQILSEADRTKYATDAGTHMHIQLGRIVISDQGHKGDGGLIEKILQNPILIKLFSPLAQTEVPIAGLVNNRFVSRRIDRLLIDNQNKTVWILDYKTDVNRDVFIDVYRNQLQEYAKLMRQIYPDYGIEKYILWTHNWVLESV